MKTLRSYSSRETADLGVRLAKQFLKTSNKKISAKTKAGALVVALQGDLGAGKTTFAQGFARGLGIKRRTASPTFIIMRRFSIPAIAHGRHAQFKNFYHMDAYRFKKLDSLEVLGLEEVLENPENILLIEWPEKIKKILPKRTIWLKFRHGKKENERIITGAAS